MKIALPVDSRSYKLKIATMACQLCEHKPSNHPTDQSPRCNIETARISSQGITLVFPRNYHEVAFEHTEIIPCGYRHGNRAGNTRLVLLDFRLQCLKQRIPKLVYDIIWNPTEIHMTISSLLTSAAFLQGPASRNLAMRKYSSETKIKRW